MTKVRTALALALFVSGSASAGAGDQGPSPATEQETSLEAYAAAAPRCVEWSDGCAICLRDGAAARCSTPGIACQPSPIVCRAESGK
ncbi:MAG TPA: hypothetical protein VKV96_17835 [Roseiarcus sp.]|nr:hypothetical protein [Roseiarcus sp.]